MLISYKRGQGSIVLRVKIRNSSVSTGAGLTGLTSGSSGLIISTIADNEATATAYSSTNIESITTLGTFAAPTSGKVRFKEVDATNHKGVYEIQIADARYAVSSAKSLLVSVSGATDAAECDVLIPLNMQVNVESYGDTAGTFASGRPEVNATHLAGAAYASADFSATMKASINSEADTALSDYGALKPTTAGRTLDVSATGEAGIDWGNVGSPTTTLNLSGTTVSTSQVVASVSGNVGGNVTGSVGSVGTNGLSAASLAADAGSEIASAVRTELATELARIDAAISTRLATAGYTAPLDAAGTRTAVGLASANLDTQLAAIAGYIDTEVGAIYSRIGAPAGASIAADIAAVKSDSAAILDDTGTSGVAVGSAGVTSIWTSALTEAYGTDGSALTGAQLLYLLLAHVGEFVISGTSKTLKKLDGATTAATYTLNDGTTPTGITRAS